VLARAGAGWGDADLRAAARPLLAALRGAVASASQAALVEGIWAMASFGGRAAWAQRETADVAALLAALRGTLIYVPPRYDRGGDDRGVAWGGQGGGDGPLTARQVARAVWAAGKLDADLAPLQLAALLAPLRRTQLAARARLSAEELTGVIVACSKVTGPQLELVALRREALNLVVVAGDAAAFRGYPDHAADALHAIGMLGVLPRRFVLELLDGLMADGASPGDGAAPGVAAESGSAAGPSAALPRLTPRQLELAAAAAAMLLLPREARAPVERLVRELRSRLPPDAAGGCWREREVRF
jgi:hypothetical protein